METLVEQDRITFSVSMSVNSYELLLATATVLDWLADDVVEALVDFYSREMTRSMMEVG